MNLGLMTLKECYFGLHCETCSPEADHILNMRVQYMPSEIGVVQKQWCSSDGSYGVVRKQIWCSWCSCGVVV